MRRVKLLYSDNTIAYVKPKAGRYPICMSNSGSIVLERPWYLDTSGNKFVNMHAKYSSASMDGMDISIGVESKNVSLSCILDKVNIYRIADSGLGRSIIGEFSSYFTLSQFNTWQANIPRVLFSTNEMSGAETYYLEAKILRARKKYFVSKYFNHLGVFDSVNRLRQHQEFLAVTKMEE